VRGCSPHRGTGVFLEVSGASSNDLCLMTNDFHRVEKIFELAEDAPADSVIEIANRK
jgi:hypothetical protein